jgi:L-iditol 2-dehydrogenase
VGKRAPVPGNRFNIPSVIPGKVKAVVKQKRGDGFVELLEVKEPEPKDGEYLVRVDSAGICGSDLNILHDRFPNYSVPVILGHEFAGTIEEGGSAQTGYPNGERIACETHAYICNECEYCSSGLYNLCQKRKGFGYGVDGAFTRFVRVRKALAHKLPDDISTEEGALLEPLAAAVNALTKNSKIMPGDSVVIFGPGPIGLFCLQVARLLGARVTVVGTKNSRTRFNLAEKLGAETMTNEELIGGEGGSPLEYDVSVIATGSAPAFEMALKATKPNGRVVHIGESTERASFQFSLVERKNLTINGSFSHNWPIWERAISMVEGGKVKLLPLITHRVSLENWNDGFDAVEGHSGIKALIKP